MRPQTLVLSAAMLWTGGCGGSPTGEELAATPPAPATAEPAPAPTPVPPLPAPPPAPAPSPEPTPEPEPTPTPLVVPPGTPDRRSADPDMAAMMKDSYQSPWMVALHANPSVGQWAEWDASGSRLWWGVTARVGELWLVESRMQLGQAGRVVYGYLVDAEGNVQRAFLANHYEHGIPDVGYEVRVMEKQEHPGGDAPEPEEGTDTVNAAGRDWDCKWVKVDAGGRPAISWMAEDGWFHKIVLAKYDGNVSMELSALGTDARQGIRVPEPGGLATEPEPEPSPPMDPPQEPRRRSDMASMMKDSFKAPWMVALHEFAQIGQWAEWEASGQKMWWGVTGIKNGNLVVESRMGGLTYAYVVDSAGNTLEAYIANWSEVAAPEVAHRVKVMEKQEAVAGEGPEPEQGTETVNAAGRDWSCQWFKVDAGGKPATSWIADDAWFNKIIKAEYDGVITMVLSRVGNDAQMGFRFPSPR